MPILTLYPQANGFYTRWDSIVGGVPAWDAVNDETSDGDSSYLILSTSVFAASVGRVSFMFGGLSNIKPISITLDATVKTQSGMTTPTMAAGFCRSAGGALSTGTTFQTAGSYVSRTTTFATNPLTGSAWAAGGLNGIEMFIQMVTSADLWIARLTRLVGLVTYDEPSYARRGDLGAVL